MAFHGLCYFFGAAGVRTVRILYWFRERLYKASLMWEPPSSKSDAGRQAAAVGSGFIGYNYM